jgi:hypothetical protein
VSTWWVCGGMAVRLGVPGLRNEVSTWRFAVTNGRKFAGSRLVTSLSEREINFGTRLSRCPVQRDW